MNPKRLPSGSYRCRVYIGKVNGKEKYVSFTADTKDEAEQMAVEWKKNRKKRITDLTVIEAINRYIDAKAGVLSPATIRGYRSQADHYYTDLDVPIGKVTDVMFQTWMSKFAVDHKPKTCRNALGLLTAALQLTAGINIHVTVPARQKVRYELPADDDIIKLLSVSKTELWIAIMLGRYYGLRRGEICALTSDDLKGDTLWITKDMVMDEDKQWITKATPKTSDSYRSLTIAEPLLGVLKGIDGRFITCHPDALVNRFKRALKVAKIQPFNFHLFRHCFASRGALAGIPDTYLARMGGWRPDSPVLKQVYQNAFEAEMKKQMAVLNAQIPCHVSCHVGSVKSAIQSQK